MNSDVCLCLQLKCLAKQIDRRREGAGILDKVLDGNAPPLEQNLTLLYTTFDQNGGTFMAYPFSNLIHVVMRKERLKEAFWLITDRLKLTLLLSTVKPVISGHPRDPRYCPLNPIQTGRRGGFFEAAE